MKKFLWLPLLLLALLAALPLASATAAERGDDGDRHEREDRDERRHADESDFVANGILCITALPEVHVSPSREGFRIVARGEELSGFISTSDGWDALTDAGVSVTIKNEVSNFNVSTGTFEGRLVAEINVVTSDGDVLSGRLRGSIQGLFDPELAQTDLLLSIFASSVEGDWRIHNRGTRASGTAHASFSPTDLDGDGVPEAFCGGLTLDGSVRA